MQPRIDEIADRVYRFSTYVPDIGPTGFTFNQFLVDADEPLLFHTGLRALFPMVSSAVASVVPLAKLRWITFGHLEADESGSINEWLAAAPNSQVAHSAMGCMVSINDLADRQPRSLGTDEVLDLGGRRVRNLDTPHVPHGWDAHVLFEETTGTLLCGDLLSQVGDGPPITSNDILETATQTEDMFQSTCLTPNTAPTIRALADLRPTTLAIMHGSSYNGDCAKALADLADDYERRMVAAPGAAARREPVEPLGHA
ncbi:MAG TPA: MBL fold metallo-hydrolase [Acidimicrobiales bacterium]|nr:MBL fold metallo-hydrolase [Acidimicrobiales bacterium]